MLQYNCYRTSMIFSWLGQPPGAVTMTSWHKISLIYFHFNYGKTSSIWRFRPIASSPSITSGRSPPEIKIRSHWSLSARFFAKKNILLYVWVTVPRMAEQNTENRANEARSKAKQTKRSIEGHGKYLIDSTYTAPDTWISLKKKNTCSHYILFIWPVPNVRSFALRCGFS